MSGAEPLEHAAFSALVKPHHAEIKLHCYRMLGSPQDADDLTQETLARAWRARGRLNDASAVRAWLYRIATNACLDEIRRRPPRLAPDDLGPPSTGMPQSGTTPLDERWLEPYPDAWLDGVPDASPGPEALYELQEAVRFAFVAAIHALPPRQRAVLVLRDVLGFSAAETAGLLNSGVEAVNSALQRARKTLAVRNAEGPSDRPPVLHERERALAAQYAAAWENRNLKRFIALLTQNATFTMPPWRHWYRGREGVRTFFGRAWRSYHSFRLVPTAANRQPALAAYARRVGDDAWAPHSIHVLTMRPDGISRVVCFVRPLGPQLFGPFALPEVPQEHSC